MEETVGIIDQVCRTLETIAKVADEQRRAAADISGAVDGMFQATKDVANNTQIAASAASEAADNIMGIKQAIDLVIARLLN
ncbi:MAG: hypothetical protein IT292_01220 [Deltaproteobacteria bacterium]|nr:hypothetical protein [Deltaproteobacteria bacterium]